MWKAKCHWVASQTRPDFMAMLQYPDQQPQRKGEACSRERALCSLLLSKDFKSSLVKRKKGLNYEITSFCLKYFTQGKKNKRGWKEKKNLFSAFDLFLGFSIPPTLWDDAVCQIPTAPAIASSGRSPPHTITLLSEAAGVRPAHADSIDAGRTAPPSGRLFSSWSKAARREEGRRC